MAKKIYKNLMPVFLSFACISAMAQSQMDSNLTAPQGVQNSPATQSNGNASVPSSNLYSPQNSYALDSNQTNASSAASAPYGTQDTTTSQQTTVNSPQYK